ncbi:SOS response-associated peptidase [Occultella glacieicola]|uniref:Abasic site processing protein n=1 Tax=Occultella glacieicola TaxID=2518684 RepID=A0ABY2E7D2_9MICO|nr:SOS response-associated peptidase [Occultella glacieicola]TDE97459.1 SOS response-associated peptidase [Occultella glacieicola]
MCGRYASFREAQDLADAFDVEEVTDAAAQVAANYNVAPTDPVRIVLDRAPKPATADVEQGSDGGAGSAVRREMHAARWGLVPAWAKDLSVGARMFNARSESLAEKNAFRKPLEAKRCIVVADGYYEWLKKPIPGSRKLSRTPFYIHPTDGSPVAFAGLYAWWPDPSKDADDPERWVLSATIITADARDGLEQIHDREPAMLTPEGVATWLDPRVTDAGEALAVLAAPAPAVSWHEVGAQVGSVRNNSPELIRAI